MLLQTREQGRAALALGAPTRWQVFRARASVRLVRAGAFLLSRLLGTADGRAVGAMAARELALILRSAGWSRFLWNWGALCSAIVAVPVLYRFYLGRWHEPTGPVWFLLCGYGLQIGVFLAMMRWNVGRTRRDLYSHRLDELMLTRCSCADIATGEALASAIASLWVVSAALPFTLFLGAIAGAGGKAALLLAVSLVPAAALGVWFGMGWGLAFTLRRSSAVVPLSKWWFLGPFLPLLIGWCAIGFLSLVWLMLGLVPGSFSLVRAAAQGLGWLAGQILWHWNPLLLVGAVIGYWDSNWVTGWLTLLAYLLFMMRKSTDAIQASLSDLPEARSQHEHGEYWIHHDVHHFTQYGEPRRRIPQYRDGANAVAAFDVALGHRVFLHPFLWCLALLLYLFLLGWSLLLPHLGRYTATACVLIPATGALLLMSGGVAVSFGWERDQHRWPALAALPIANLRLALGKIKGVVRPTLWIGLVASLTALLLGWRGALPTETSLWMALHVVTFPVSLACVTATLALTTPTLGEALYRWAVLGAIPTLLTVLPHPIGGQGGLALPFTPPLMVLLLVVSGPTSELVRAAWISLGLEVVGVAGALVILSLFLRRWTVGERD